MIQYRSKQSAFYFCERNDVAVKTQTNHFHAGRGSSRPHKKSKKRNGCAFYLVCCTLLCTLAAGMLSATHHPARDNSHINQKPFTEPADWALLLVNRDHPLPEDYTVETVTLDNGQQIDARIYPALQNMFDDMREDGIYPVVGSGFRTAAEQQQIMDEKIAAYQAEGYSDSNAREKAAEWVAPVGTSEHQTGLAVDINADGVQSTGQEVYDWLLQHAAEYGFIKRYTTDKQDITGFSDEPWHYRYVGQDAAEEIMRQKICLEEYLGLC